MTPREITSRRNPLLRHLKRLGTDRAYRDARGEFLCDGLKLYEEALRWGVTITQIASSDRDFAASVGDAAFFVPTDVLASISPQQSPQTVVFSCAMPFAMPPISATRVLVLDGIQDPGNLGTLIRTANAFHVEQMILCGNCADVWNPKTIRAAMGAVFRQSICRMTIAETADYLHRNNLQLFGAAADSTLALGTANLPPRTAIAIGSEGQGLSAELLAHCNGTVSIPMNPACESLNAAVAGAILLWEQFRGSKP